MASSEQNHQHRPAQDCGRRLLAHLIDQRAADNHGRPFASIPLSKNPRDGYRDIHYTVLANAINRLAIWLLHELGAPRRHFETFVYFAAMDLRYQIVCLAAMKAGYVAFLPSSRNSYEAFESLLNESGADALVTDAVQSPGVSLMQRARPMRVVTIPSLDVLLDPSPVPHVPMNTTWEEYRFAPFLQIHSSGSTGLPKLVTIKHGSLTCFDAFQRLDTNEVFKRLGNQRILVSFPLFHIAGLMYGLAAPCWFDSTTVLPPAGPPLTADIVDKIHVEAKVEFSALMPSIVSNLAQDESCLENLSRLNGIAFAGGPLSELVGQRVVEKTILHAGYGASEWIVAPLLKKAPEDWAYMRFNELAGGFDFRERDDGHFELCIVRKSEYELFQPVFVNFPELDEFCSKDLFLQHPTKPGLWKYASRADDIIVFSNGEKLNPVTFEGIVTASPYVKGCVVFGQGRFQASVLIEPADENESDLLSKVWPSIEKANAPTVKHGRITKDHVLFTTAEKPLPRAGKGTVQRAAANKLYADEIHAHYLSFQHTKKDTMMVLDNLESSRASLMVYLCKELDIESIDESTDLFSLGLDSLQVINLVRAISSSQPSSVITTRDIYENPTIHKLAYLLQRGAHHYDYSNDSDDEDLKESWLAMDDMYESMTSKMLSPKKKKRGLRRRKTWLQAESHTVKPVIQPDGGVTAWLQVLAMFLVNMNNWGLVNSFGVFQAYYEQDLLAAYSASSIAWIGTLQGALLLIVGVLSGPLFDMGYFKHMLVLGSLGLVFALMMLSLATEYYAIMLSQGVLLGICEGLLYIPSVALVPVYFKKNRGLALGLSTGGGSIGGVAYPAIFHRLLQAVGFAWAVRIIGFIALATLTMAIVLSKPLSPRSPRQILDLSAFRDPSYVTFVAAAFFLLAGVFVPSFLAPSYSTSQLQTSSSLSFSLLSLLNAGQFFGRLLPAWSSDWKHKYLGPEALLFLAELALAILGFSWAAVHNLSGYIPWLVIYGFFSGFAITLPAVVLPYICPSLASYGTRIGMLYAFSGLGFLISAPVAAAVNGVTGNFLGGQIWTGATCVVAAALFLFTSVDARRQRLRYEMGKRDRGVGRLVFSEKV